MPFTLNDLLWGLAAPILIAAGLRFVLSIVFDRFRPGSSPSIEEEELPPQRSVAFAIETCLPLVVAAAVGYFMLSLGPWVPDAHYEWLPLGVVLAAVTASLLDFFRWNSLVRWIGLPIGYAAIVGLVGYVLMPTWEGLEPSYTPYLACWCVGVLVISLTNEWTPGNGGWPMAVVWLGTCLAAAVVVALSESLRFAQVAGLSFSAGLGLVVTGIVLKRSLLGGLGLTLTVYLAGILLIAQVNSFSDVPLVSYWLPIAGPFISAIIGFLLPAKASGLVRGLAIVLPAATVSAIGVILAVVATMPE